MGIDSVSWYEFGPYRLDAEQFLLLREGEKLALAPRAVHVLKLLLEQQGNVVTKQHLLERVWPDTFVTEGILARHICDLRKGLDGYGAAIETVPRRGYRFTSPAQFRREPGAANEAPRSLAVLPFRVFRSDHAYLGLGLCDAIITRMGRLRDVEVRPTSAVAAFTAKSAEALEVGLALRVNSVLEGTLRVLGSRVRLTLQLVGIPSNTTLWAGKFDCAFDDLFEMEDEVTIQIVAALALKLGGVAQRTSTSEPAPNAEAYRLVMQAKYLRSHHAGSQSLRDAAEVLQRALALDPQYAAAHAELAFCYALHPMFGASTPDAVPRAKAAALKALEFEPEQQRARWTLAFIQWHYDFDWRHSEPELRRVLAINPYDADACHTLAMLLAETGRIAEATTMIERAMHLEPTSALVHGSAGMVEYFAGRYQEAVALCRKGLQFDPNCYRALFVLGLSLGYQQKHDAAIRALQKATAGGDPQAYAAMVHVYCSSGLRNKAEKLFREKLAGAADRCATAFAYASLGDRASAFREFFAAAANRTPALVLVGADPRLENLRKDPRYSQLLATVGLPERDESRATPKQL